VSKKKGMFGWLGFGQKEQQNTEEVNVDDPGLEHPEKLTEDHSTDNLSEQEEQETSINQENEVATDDTSKVTKSAFDQEVTSIDSSSLESQIIDPIGDKLENSEAELEKPKPIAELEPEHLSTSVSIEAEADDVIAEKTAKKAGFFTRLKQGLTKTRQNLGGGLIDLFRGKQIDDELFEELETHLLMADVGVETTMKIIDSLTQSANRKQLKDASALYELLKIELKKVIEEVSKPLNIPTGNGPFVILMVGVNGVGKTTTIGKLAKQFQADGKSVMLAAGDTFRAAAVEQLQVWGERNDIPVIAQHTGADSASVIFDAISAAKARNVDIIIADTAGRLQNKAHLMEELKKVVRVMKKLDVNAPHEVMLTIDAGTGQNALSQTKLFNEAVGLTGLTITKLDGTAKGGVVFAVADKHQIPIRYLGVGEGIDDLRPFIGEDFIDALFSK
jgi:fused signal recognition particle receptor